MDSDKLASLLRDGGMRIEQHREHFPRGTSDEDWIPTVAARNWSVLTCDRRLRSVPSEREAITRANARVFIYRGRAKPDQIANTILAVAPRLEKYVQRWTRPLIVHITGNGNLFVKEGVRRGGRKRQR